MHFPSTHLRPHLDIEKKMGRNYLIWVGDLEDFGKVINKKRAPILWNSLISTLLRLVYNL